MAHQRETGRGDVTYLVIAIVLGEAIVGYHTAIHPTALCEMTIKDVVEVKSEDRLLHADGILPWLESVAQTDGCGAIAWQRTSLALGVVEILTADEIGMPYCLEISETECCHTIEHHRRRESKGGVIIVLDTLHSSGFLWM